MTGPGTWALPAAAPPVAVAPEMDRIYRALDHCDLFVAIGTSGHVYPAAGFVEAVAGARTVELNLESSLVASAFQEARTGRATDLVPDFVSELLDG